MSPEQLGMISIDTEVDIDRIADALERIADALEGKQHKHEGDPEKIVALLKEKIFDFWLAI